jgi:hypothetical protein
VDLLPDPGPPYELAVLRELMHADIEYAWGSGSARRADE